jgi:hypothetical protein
LFRLFSAVFSAVFRLFFGCAVGHVHFSFARPKEKQNQRERPPAVSPRLKIERFSLKRANALRFAPFGRARFFTGKSSDFLHASPKRPELDKRTPKRPDLDKRTSKRPELDERTPKRPELDERTPKRGGTG